MKKLAILQSNYIPWKGYFDIIHDVDEFCFYDDVQYTSRDWRNRNKIVTPSGIKWLSVPVGQEVHRLICDVTIEDPEWQRRHLEPLKFAYSRHPYYKQYKPFLEDVYLGHTWTSLSELNHYMTEIIARDFLHCSTVFTDSRSYETHGAKHEKLLSLVKAAGADFYESGPAAKDYIIAEDYRSSGIQLVWKDYSDYPEYPQLNTETFTHQVSVLDLLFNTGDEAPWYIWGWREKEKRSSWIEQTYGEEH